MGLNIYLWKKFGKQRSKIPKIMNTSAINLSFKVQIQPTSVTNNKPYQIQKLDGVQ